MRSLLGCVLAVTVTAFLTTAAYGETYVLEFSPQTNEFMITNTTPTPNNKYVVEVTSAPTSATFNLSYTSSENSVINPELSRRDPTKSVWTAEISKSSIAPCTVITVTSSTSQASTLQLVPPPSGILQEGDLGAEEYWQSQCATNDLKNLQDRFKGKTLLVHLPSGNKAAGYPASVPETATLLFVFIVPQTVGPHSYSVDITQCPERNPFPVKGEFPVTNGGFEKMAAAAKYRLVAIDQDVRCGSGTLQYKVHLTPNDDGKAQQLTIRPVYQAAVTVAYGFDTYSVQSFEVQSGKIARLTDRSGTSLLVGYTWFPWGFDAENMKKRNYFANPFALIDPKNPTDYFVVGTAITARGGLSVAIGASFHKKTVLKGVNVGDSFTGAGAIPTRTAWEGQPGLYIGVAMDSNVFTTLKGLWTKANPK